MSPHPHPDVQPCPPPAMLLISRSVLLLVTKTSDVQGLSLQEHKSLENTTTCLHVIRPGAARCSNLTVWRSSRSVPDETSFATLNISLIINQNLQRGTTSSGCIWHPGSTRTHTGPLFWTPRTRPKDQGTIYDEAILTKLKEKITTTKNLGKKK